MNPEQVTYFGETDSRGKRVKFGIKAKDRTRHIYVIGKTGMGKSTVLENMAIQDIQNGSGLAFMDPHGKTADLLLKYVPPERMNDVVYFAPFDIENPISFNVLEDVGVDKRHLVVAGLMSTFKKIWVDAWSARMEYMLTNTLLALIEYPGATLLGVNRMLADKEYRKKVVENVKDPSVKSFWVDEFAKYTDRMAQEAVPAIQNKIGQFTANPLIRNIIGQPKSSFDIRKLMDESKIIIINLSKGLVGEANANLLGSMLITKIYLAAMSRADVSEKDLKNLPNFYLYVDEFQSFANESFADILSEARKYKLNLTIAHQYVEQMSEEVRAAVFGNVGTMITFRVGAYDAEVLEKEFAPQFTAEDLVNLGMYQMYLKLMIDGVGSVPFSATGIPPFPEPVISYKTEIIEASRKNYSKPRTEVEEVINKWMEEMKTPPKKNTSSVANQKTNLNNLDNKKVYPSSDLKDTIKKIENEKISQNTIVEKTDKTETKEKFDKQNFKPKFEKTSNNFKREFPPIESDPDDDFLPLKELAKNIDTKNTEENKESDLKKDNKIISKNGGSKIMSEENLSNLRSVLDSVLKKTQNTEKEKKIDDEPKSDKVVEKETVKEEIKKETPLKNNTKENDSDSKKEISEKELKKVLGIE